MPLNAQSATRKDTATAKAVSLQHRHFAFIAATLKACNPGGDGIQNLAMHQWKDTVMAFAAACAASNPKFSRARFLAACETD